MNHPFSSLTRRLFAVFLCFPALLSPLSGEEKVIAIVRDRDSQSFDGIITHFTKELENLAEKKYIYRLKDAFNAKYREGEPA